MKETFSIELAERKKINKLGTEIFGFGFFFLLMFGMCLLPAKYLPSEIATIYLFEVVNKNIYIILSGSLFLVLFGEWLRGLRSYEKAELEVKTDGISIFSATRSIDLKYEEIIKFGGHTNLFHGLLRSIHKLNFIIKTIDNKKIEIRSHEDVFDGLTEYFPTKT